MRNAPRRTISLRRGLVAASLLSLALPLSCALGGTLILRIMVTNPFEGERAVPIRSNLPPGVGTNDVVGIDSRLSLDYDVRNDVYYVHGDIQLAGKQTDALNVEIRDIWSIPEETLARLAGQAADIGATLAGSKQAGIAAALRTRIDEALRQLRAAQNENAVARGVQPVRHIRAHESNLKLLQSIRKDVGRLENLALAEGHDPGRLVGEPRVTPKPNREFEIPEEEYRTAKIRISVRNTSLTETQSVPIRRELPMEIQTFDVLDPGGLEVRRDSKTGGCYLYLENVELEPGAERAFDVTIRDKWNINGPRVTYLAGIATNLLVRFATKEKFQSIEVALQEQLSQLQAIGGEAGPAVLNESYVAFYRGQSARLDAIEAVLARITDALKPIEKTTKMGLPGKPPTPRTTWRVIFGIVAFLFVLSLLFFFRWYGRTKAERETAA